MEGKRRAVLRIGPAWIWSAFMIGASSIPRLPESPAPLFHHDKLLHLVEYALLAWLWGRVFRHSPRPILRRHAFSIVLAGGLACGALDEVYQGWIGRSRDGNDFFADAAAVASVQLFQRIRDSRKGEG